MGTAAEKHDEPSGMSSARSWPSSSRRRPTSTRGAAAPAAHLLLLLLAVASAASLAEAGYVAVDVDLASDLCTRPHREMFDVLHRTLRGCYPLLEVEGHRFLSIQNSGGGTQPSRILKLRLAGCGAGDRITLAISDGDAGVLAYADGAGRWHAFPGFEALFPGATVLPFNGSYDHLIGGCRNLPTVPLGRASALEAIQALSGANGQAATTAEAKAALVRLMAMTTEALRWKPIRRAFGDDWEEEAFITEEMAEYVDHWVDLSYLLWRWDLTGTWEEGPMAEGARKIGVHDAAQALSVIDLLKRPKEVCVGDGEGDNGEDDDEADGATAEL